MSKPIRRFVGCSVLFAGFALLMPTAANAAHGVRSGGGSPAHVGHPGQPAAVRRAAVPKHANHSGPLSYNAYWRAAASPTPPRANQDYNRYWQQMQAWQEHRPR